MPPLFPDESPGEFALDEPLELSPEMREAEQKLGELYKRYRLAALAFSASLLVSSTSPAAQKKTKEDPLELRAPNLAVPIRTVPDYGRPFDRKFAQKEREAALFVLECAQKRMPRHRRNRKFLPEQGTMMFILEEAKKQKKTRTEYSAAVTNSPDVIGSMSISVRSLIVSTADMTHEAPAILDFGFDGNPNKVEGDRNQPFQDMRGFLAESAVLGEGNRAVWMDEFRRAVEEIWKLRTKKKCPREGETVKK